MYCKKSRKRTSVNKYTNEPIYEENTFEISKLTLWATTGLKKRIEKIRLNKIKINNFLLGISNLLIKKVRRGFLETDLIEMNLTRIKNEITFTTKEISHP